MKPILLALAAGAALAHAPLHAQPPGPPPHDPMAMFDADRDGNISLAELRAGSARLFSAIDANGDGRITMDEMRAHHEKLMAAHGGAHMGPPPGGHAGPPPGGPHPPRFEDLDSDHDGAISLAEFQQHLEQHFAMIDANHDGVVSHDELQAAHRAMHPPHP